MKIINYKDMMKRTWIIIMFCLMVTNSLAQKGNWLDKLEQIKPLVSTEANVEKLLGKATDRYADVGEYKTKDGEFSVTYSTGKCHQKSTSSEYNVEKGIVISIDFTPKRKIIFSALEIDTSNSTISYTDDVSPMPVTNSNQKIGKSYTVTENLLRYFQVEPGEGLWYLGCDRINK